MSQNNISQTYELSGGSFVTVHKPFGANIYTAEVRMPSGAVYPEPGKVALDVGRQEFITVVTGSMLLQVNGDECNLIKGDTYLLKDGDKYSIKATEDLIACVLVEDQEDGKTEIIDEI